MRYNTIVYATRPGDNENPWTFLDYCLSKEDLGDVKELGPNCLYDIEPSSEVRGGKYINFFVSENHKFFNTYKIEEAIGETAEPGWPVHGDTRAEGSAINEVFSLLYNELVVVLKDKQRKRKK